MKKYIIIVFLILFSLNKAYAQELKYYENNNGVIVTEKEYNFIINFYSDEYFEIMTEEDFNWLKDLKINENEVEIIEFYDNNFLLKSTSHITASKKLTIAKSCSTTCMIIVKCQWLINPVVRSYDVIGARLNNTEVVGAITTKVTSSGGTEYFSNLKTLSNGFGVSIKLPPSNNISIEQKYSVSKSGTIYASYQHATSSISLSTSKLYTISSSGYGGVFNFTGAATGIYDKMQGVSIEL